MLKEKDVQKRVRRDQACHQRGSLLQCLLFCSNPLLLHLDTEQSFGHGFEWEVENERDLQLGELKGGKRLLVDRTCVY